MANGCLQQIAAVVTCAEHLAARVRGVALVSAMRDGDMNIEQRQGRLISAPATIRGVDNLQPFKGQKVLAVSTLVNRVRVRTSVTLQFAAA